MSSASEGYIGVSTTALQPTQTVTIEQALRLMSKSLRVCMPARVVSVNGDNKVDVEPGFQARFATKPQAVTLPIISQVPIVQPQGANYSIQLPIAENDTGLLIFADRCIDPWLNGTGIAADPNDPRLHDLTDAIFVPGLLTSDTAANQTPYGTDLVLRNGQAKLHVQKQGTYKIENNAAELVSAVRDLANAVQAIATATSTLQIVTLTGQPNPASAAVLGNLSTQAGALATKIGTLVGQ